MDSSEDWTRITRIFMRIGEKTRFARIWPSASKIGVSCESIRANLRNVGVRIACPRRLKVSVNWNPEGPRIEKNQSREAILKKSSFRYGMKVSIENVFSFWAPLWPQKNRARDWNFRARMKISNQERIFQARATHQGGLILSCTHGKEARVCGRMAAQRCSPQGDSRPMNKGKGGRKEEERSKMRTSEYKERIFQARMKMSCVGECFLRAFERGWIFFDIRALWGGSKGIPAKGMGKNTLKVKNLGENQGVSGNSPFWTLPSESICANRPDSRCESLCRWGSTTPSYGGWGGNPECELEATMNIFQQLLNGSKLYPENSFSLFLPWIRGERTWAIAI